MKFRVLIAFIGKITDTLGLSLPLYVLQHQLFLSSGNLFVRNHIQEMLVEMRSTLLTRKT